MSVAGELHIAVHCAAHTVAGVDIVSSRPQASRLLLGRSADEAVAGVPMLFSICARAQQLAATAAVEAARGHAPSAEQAATRTRRVLVEALQEHLWRLLLDWPALLDLPEAAALRAQYAQRHKQAAPLLAAAPEAACREFGAAVLAELDAALLPLPIKEWDALSTPAELAASCRARGQFGRLLMQLADESFATPSVQHGEDWLPELPAAALAAQMPLALTEEFARTPELAGSPRETGALARFHAVPLVASLLAAGQRIGARVVARIHALIDCARRLAGHAEAASPEIDASVQNGIATSRVLTARGMLLHRVALEADRVAAWQIVAPTEWNFHPRGALARELAGLAAQSTERLRQVAQAAVLALDPCVAYRVEVRHA